MSSSSNLFLSDTSFDPFSPFTDYPLDFDILQEITQISDQDFPNPISQIPSPLLSSSPPSHLLQNLSLNYQSTHLQNPPVLSVKSEESQFPLYYFNGGNHYDENNAEKIMQRSFSSRLFQPMFDGVMENVQTQTLSSPENTFISTSGQMRRACSTGDLQVKSRDGLLSSPSAPAPGRYTAEERRERIHRYRAKRAQRNFNKTIKYACRKTLADNRPRIRGRFARNDEPSEMIPKPATFNRYDEEDDLWMDNFNDEEDEGTIRGGHVFNLLDPSELQYYNY
ncbi:two-component response regulator-like APRR3 [Impatiens glandulifera]|uniref:two-component response regulator-like APRR3 n=1 Tax=Impatiens glandulifera TaxID=253017 RepID=UPI001FB078E3|nr:two-component response regulator-like APRR3 [Impatiens glandulifera]